MRPLRTKGGSGPAFLPGLFLLFVFWVLVNACLSYAPFPWAVKGILFLLLFAPLFLAGRNALQGPASSIPLWEMESLPSLPRWVLALLFLAALGARLYGLTTIPVWPMIDEGATAFFSTHLAQHWTPNLFFDFNHIPPLYFWMLASFFMVVPPSLFSLWLFPALVSFGTVVVGHGVGRGLFSRSFSLLWVFILGLSFWPLYVGRFCLATVLVPPLEFFCLAALAGFLRNRARPAAGSKLLILGIGLGLGFYIYFNWPLIALMMLAVVAWALRERPGRWKLFLYVFLPLLALTLPLGLGYSKLPSTLDYFGRLWVFQQGFSWLPYLKTAFSYITALFWGVDPGIANFAYRPVGGGFLNPILGSFCFIGLAHILRERKSSWARWWFAAFLIFISPVFFTNNLEMFRIIDLLPLVLFPVVLGIQKVLTAFPKKGRVVFLVLVLTGSFGLDLWHLGWAYPSYWNGHLEAWEKHGKMAETYRAYQVLKPLAERQGPGLLLTEFTAALERDPRNKSLVVACYPFDAARNKALDPGQASWAALFATTRQLPGLKARFPGHEPLLLGNDLDDRPDENYFMVLVPLDPTNRALFERWTRADRFLEDLLFQSLCPASKDHHRALCEQLLSHHSLFQGETFLESHYWPLLFDQAVKAEDRPLQDLVLKNALRCDCVPGRDLWDWGVGSVNVGNFAGAETAFRAAHRMDPSVGVTGSTLEQIHQKALLQKDLGPSGLAGTPP